MVSIEEQLQQARQSLSGSRQELRQREEELRQFRSDAQRIRAPRRDVRFQLQQLAPARRSFQQAGGVERVAGRIRQQRRSELNRATQQEARLNQARQQIESRDKELTQLEKDLGQLRRQELRRQENRSQREVTQISRGRTQVNTTATTLIREQRPQQLQSQQSKSTERINLGEQEKIGGFSGFVSKIPTFARIKEERRQTESQKNISEFERLSPESQLRVAKSGGLGTRFVPAGQVERQLGREGTVFFETPKAQSTFSLLKERFTSGRLTRDILTLPTANPKNPLAGEILVGALRGITGTIEQLPKSIGLQTDITNRDVVKPFKEQRVFKTLREQPVTFIGQTAGVASSALVFGSVGRGQIRAKAIESTIQRGALNQLEGKALDITAKETRGGLTFQGGRQTDLARQVVVGSQKNIPRTDLTIGATATRTRVKEFGIFPKVPISRAIENTEVNLPLVRRGERLGGIPSIISGGKGVQFGGTAVPSGTQTSRIQFDELSQGRRLTGTDLRTGRRFRTQSFIGEPVQTPVGRIKEFVSGEVGETPVIGRIRLLPDENLPTSNRVLGRPKTKIVRPFGGQTAKQVRQRTVQSTQTPLISGESISTTRLIPQLTRQRPVVPISIQRQRQQGVTITSGQRFDSLNILGGRTRITNPQRFSQTSRQRGGLLSRPNQGQVQTPAQRQRQLFSFDPTTPTTTTTTTSRGGVGVFTPPRPEGRGAFGFPLTPSVKLGSSKGRRRKGRGSPVGRSPSLTGSIRFNVLGERGRLRPQLGRAGFLPTVRPVPLLRR